MSPAPLSPNDRGFLFGDGVFDTLLAVGRRPLAGHAHVDRLIRHAAAIGIVLQEGAVRGAIDAAMASAEAPMLILRTTATRGTAARGLWPAAASQPTVLATATAFDPAIVGASARLVTGSFPRNDRSPLAAIKSLNYLDNILLAREAAAAGADDTLILNTRGNVACTTIANVFALFGSTLVTPPIGEGAMEGVIRGLILREPPPSWRVVEDILPPARLRQADALFLTNSLRLVRPVVGLDGRAIASREPAALLLDTVLAALARDADLTTLIQGIQKP